ncbi:MAG: hypothetical protein FJ206_09265 [Gemmatimonadetes bacterium]|nr:hypothetical protein [Gemmatimonadota bacterium]
MSWWLIVGLVGGEIFGEVRFGTDYLANTEVALVCGSDTVSAKTDSTGSYRLRAAATGKCIFSVALKSQRLTLDVVVFERPTRYRLVVEERAGKLVLKRV